jgi:hypothetical protein
MSIADCQIAVKSLRKLFYNSSIYFIYPPTTAPVDRYPLRHRAPPECQRSQSSAATPLPFDRTVRLRTVVDLTEDPGAWLGLALWDGEADYRELALYWRADGLRVGWWAPCYWRDITAVRPGARDLQITYTPPPSAVCWQAHVDGALVHSEACTHAGAPLVGNAHAGLWVVKKHTKKS